MMTADVNGGTYDEALERFHTTGPEFDGWLSNHGPMVVEAMTRRGAGDRVHAWTDWYSQRLGDAPRGITPIAPDAWRDPLGDPSRSGDWIALMLTEVRERDWRDVLTTWWPRLLPGMAAGATHGVIRVGHAVQALAAHETPPRIDELAHALAYWASRWQPIPSVEPIGDRSALQSLIAIPAVPEQRYGIRNRLSQLPDTPGYTQALTTWAMPADPATALDALVDAAVTRYASGAHGNPTMLVHTATAPAAVARVLPHLPTALHAASVRAAWAASGAVTAAYRAAEDLPALDLAGRTAGDLWAQALGHRGEHVIKLADTALAAAERAGDTGHTDGLAAAARAIELDA